MSFPSRLWFLAVALLPLTVQAAGTPRIDSVYYSSPQVGTEVLINGQFAPNKADNKIWLNNKSLTVDSASPTMVTFLLSAKDNSGPLIVESKIDNAWVKSAPYNFVLPTPVIRKISAVEGSTIAPGKDFYVEVDQLDNSLTYGAFIDKTAVPLVTGSASPERTLRFTWPTDNLKGGDFYLTANGLESNHVTLPLWVGPHLYRYQLEQNNTQLRLFGKYLNGAQFKVDQQVVKATANTGEEALLPLPTTWSNAEPLVWAEVNSRLSNFLTLEISHVTLAPNITGYEQPQYNSEKNTYRWHIYLDGNYDPSTKGLIVFNNQNYTPIDSLFNSVYIELNAFPASDGILNTKVNGVLGHPYPYTINPQWLPVVDRLEIPNTAGTNGAAFTLWAAQCDGRVKDITITGNNISKNSFYNSGASTDVFSGRITGTFTQQTKFTPQAGSLTINCRNGKADISYNTTDSNFVSPPQIFNLSFPAGPRPGQKMIIGGRHFGTDRGDLVINIGTQKVKANSMSDDQISATLPTPLADGSYKVSVANPHGLSGTLNFTLTKDAPLWDFRFTPPQTATEPYSSFTPTTLELTNRVTNAVINKLVFSLTPLDKLPSEDDHQELWPWGLFEFKLGNQSSTVWLNKDHQLVLYGYNFPRQETAQTMTIKSLLIPFGHTTTPFKLSLDQIQVSNALSREAIALSLTPPSTTLTTTWSKMCAGNQIIDDHSCATISSSPVTPTSTTPTPTTPTSTVEIPDLNQVSWAVAAITKLAQAAVIRNHVAFHPTQTITRAEFLKMIFLARAVDCAQTTTLNFTDVPPAAWYHKYVACAVSRQIVQGKTPTRFDPLGSLTRAEAAKIIGKLQNWTVDQSPTSTFKDVTGWAIKWVNTAVREQIFRGFANQTFRPNQPLTRAEAAVVIAKLLP